MGRAVEAHMLQEVCQSTLVGFLLDSSHLLCNVEVSTVLRILVMTDIVGKTVFQLSDAYSRILSEQFLLLSYP